MNLDSEILNEQKAWVIFSNNTDLPWLKWLRKGFRHCSVLINDGEHWITFDPLSNYTDIVVHSMPSAFDLPLWLEDRGHKVVSAPINRVKKPAPWTLLTCVESVKRVLGIHKCTVLTPWQLYQYLKHQK
ncbi:MAG: hypothetical protein AAF182_00680 [Pseudomonadota bacterium]